MDILNISNSPDPIFEELLQNLEMQKSDLELLRTQIHGNNEKLAQKIIDIQKNATKQFHELEEANAQIRSLIENKEKIFQDNNLEITKLNEIIEIQKKELEAQKVAIEKQKRNERIIGIIQLSCIKSHVSSRKLWPFRRIASLHFMEFIAKILKRYGVFTPDEEDLVFPQKAKKKLKAEIIILPTPEEKKKKLRDWKKIWIWKKDKE